MLGKKPHQVPSLDEVLAGDFSFQDEAPAKEEAVPPPKESPRVLAVALTEGGVKVIGRGRIRVLGPMISPNGGGQFGRTGQGGGGGGKSGGGGGNQEASAGSWRPPYTAVGTPPELREYRLPDEVRRRIDFTFSRGVVATPLVSEKPKKKGKKKRRGVASNDGNSVEPREKRGGRPKPKQRRGRVED